MADQKAFTHLAQMRLQGRDAAILAVSAIQQDALARSACWAASTLRLWNR